MFLQKKDDLQKINNIPFFHEKIFQGKSSSIALIIPVLNEGTRIRNQLTRLKKYSEIIDIIIVDGKSSDNALDEVFLESVEVTAILTKEEKYPEGLSTQLRIGYFWCLKKDYKSMITIDGNAKDNVNDIFKFIEKLENGFDYVQGSRYIKGGISKNTPLDRYLGTRFIHAPIMSFFSKNRFTDTTNGFRAYSSLALKDKRIQPFRNDFVKYELLFYLTYKISKLGYKVCEIPVERNYPSDKEEIPTKIDSFMKKVSILFQLIKVVTKQYDPKK